jgi:hypothetical protein
VKESPTEVKIGTGTRPNNQRVTCAVYNSHPVLFCTLVFLMILIWCLLGPRLLCHYRFAYWLKVSHIIDLFVIDVWYSIAGNRTDYELLSYDRVCRT